MPLDTMWRPLHPRRRGRHGSGRLSGARCGVASRSVDLRRQAWPTTGTGTFNNFIDGESVAAGGGAHDRRAQPRRPARRSPQAPDSTRRGRRPRRQGRARRVRRLVEHDARRALAGAAQARRRARGARRRARRARGAQRRQAAAGGQGRRDPGAMVDNLRFFAGAARNLEGKAAGEYLEGYTSWIRREAVGVVGQIAPWNYPLMMAIWKIGPALAAGNTIVLKPRRDDAADHAAARRDRGRVPAQGRAQRRRRRRRDRPGARHAPRRRHGLADRLGRDRQVDRPRRGRHAQARAPRARRQGAGRGLRRRRHGGRRRDDRRHRLLQRRPGLHGGDARARAARRSTTTSCRASPSRPRATRLGDTLDPETDARAAQLRAPARARRGLPRAHARPRRDRHRRQGARPARASSSSRPSSAACARTTR